MAITETNPETGVTCNQHRECVNVGKFKACTYSDGSRCSAFLKKEIADIKIPFGKKVKVTGEYRRYWKRKIPPGIKTSNGHNYKYWHINHWKFEREGIFLGYRHIRDGYVYHHYDEGSEFNMDRQIKAGLVCLSEHENPIYVPLTELEEVK